MGQGIKPEPKQEIKSRTTCNLREGSYNTFGCGTVAERFS